MLSGNVHADCCNAGFSVHALSQQGQGLNSFLFIMDDSAITDIQYVQWDFGDGENSNDKVPTHTYEYASHYSVKLTVYKNARNGIH